MQPIRGAVSSADAIAEFWEDGPVEYGCDYPKFATGDLNCDGLGDIVIGQRESDLAGEDSGGVYVFFGPRTGRWSLADADVILAGEAAGNLAGEAVLDVGDMTGDGCTDVAVVSERFDSRGDTDWNDGRVYLVGDVGAGNGSLGESIHIDPGADLWLGFPNALTANVVGGEDTSNEIWIAGRLDEQDHDVYFIFRFEGPITTDVTTDDATSYAKSGVSYFEDNDLFSVGDIDGSGEAEVITHGVEPEIGYLLHYDPFDQGELDDDVSLHCCSLFSEFESVGDLDSDGYGDFMASATGSGQLYLVFGRRGPHPYRTSPTRAVFSL